MSRNFPVTWMIWGTHLNQVVRVFLILLTARSGFKVQLCQELPVRPMMGMDSNYVKKVDTSECAGNRNR